MKIRELKKSYTECFLNSKLVFMTLYNILKMHHWNNIIYEYRSLRFGQAFSQQCLKRHFIFLLIHIFLNIVSIKIILRGYIFFFKQNGMLNIQYSYCFILKITTFLFYIIITLCIFEKESRSVNWHSPLYIYICKTIYSGLF